MRTTSEKRLEILTSVILRKEQNTSSRNVSMNMRRIGLHTRHFTIQAVDLPQQRQHWLVLRKKSTRVSKSSSRTQVVTKTPELSSNLSEPYPKS